MFAECLLLLTTFLWQVSVSSLQTRLRGWRPAAIGVPSILRITACSLFSSYLHAQTSHRSRIVTGATCSLHTFRRCSLMLLVNNNVFQT